MKVATLVVACAAFSSSDEVVPTPENSFETCNGAGACECLSRLTGCEGGCVETNDVDNCGACGLKCTVFGFCSTTGQCVGSCGPGSTPCPSSRSLQSCVDLPSDPCHCGACGVRCGPAEVCILGGCRRTTPSPTCECRASTWSA